MSKEIKYVLSIAGFDPSGGAGVLADIKTFESHGVMGFGINSAETFQNDREFEGVLWASVERIFLQAELLFKRFQINQVKIGLVENDAVLREIVGFLKGKNPQVQIVWDPVIKASAGFLLQEDPEAFRPVLKDLTLVTPNWDETLALFPEINPESPAGFFQEYQECSILLKGGHREEKGIDLLFDHGTRITIPGNPFDGFDKHGTGCVLSSAITANLALGLTLPEACCEGKKYVERFMKSNNTYLGWHRIQA